MTAEQKESYSFEQKKNRRKINGFVRMKGFEPPRLTALDPKSSAATNYATSAIAFALQIYKHFITPKYFFQFLKQNKIERFLLLKTNEQAQPSGY